MKPTSLQSVLPQAEAAVQRACPAERGRVAARVAEALRSFERSLCAERSLVRITPLRLQRVDAGGPAGAPSCWLWYVATLKFREPTFVNQWDMDAIAARFNALGAHLVRFDSPGEARRVLGSRGKVKACRVRIKLSVALGAQGERAHEQPLMVVAEE